MQKHSDIPTFITNFPNAINLRYPLPVVLFYGHFTGADSPTTNIYVCYNVSRNIASEIYVNPT